MTVTVDEARTLMRDAIADAGGRQPGEPVKAWISRAARAVGISVGRLYDIYNGESMPRWHEGETICRQAEKQRRQIRERYRDMQAWTEIAELKARLERLERDGRAFAERRAVAERPADCDGQEALDLG